jgi:hypothetical protein
MPERKTVERAREDARRGKAPSTQAGEFVREEIHHVREGKHGARSPQQAIAIGLSKARRAGVKVPKPKKAAARTKARQSSRKAEGKARRKPSAKRSRAVRGALEREGRSAGTRRALSSQARKSARSRTARSRSAAARKAVRTKGRAGRSAAARKAARTRAARG